MKIFISGGCKNGKSTDAERFAVALSETAKPLYYVATMKPVDCEDDERILRHRKSREGLGFETIEIAADIDRVVDLYDNKGTFLLDSTTALLTNEMFLWNGCINEHAAVKVSGELARLIHSVKNIVIVSDYIYSDACLYDQYTERYRCSLAQLDRACAEISDIVIEVCYGNIIIHKGRNLYEMLAQLVL